MGAGAVRGEGEVLREGGGPAQREENGESGSIRIQGGFFLERGGKNLLFFRFGCPCVWQLLVFKPRNFQPTSGHWAAYAHPVERYAGGFKYIGARRSS